MAKLRNRLSDRRIKALLVVCFMGITGVLVDLDHIVCIVFYPGIAEEATGCRLWHPYLLPLSGLVICIAGALGFGLLVYVVRNAAGTAAELNGRVDDGKH